MCAEERGDGKQLGACCNKCLSQLLLSKVHNIAVSSKGNLSSRGCLTNNIRIVEVFLARTTSNLHYREFIEVFLSLSIIYILKRFEDVLSRLH